MWKMILSRDSIGIIFWNTPKSKNVIFGFFSVLTLATCQFFEMLSHAKIIFRMLFGAFYDLSKWIQNHEIKK